MDKFEITPEQRAIAKSNGISAAVLWSRVFVTYWDMEDAITRPVRKKQPIPFTEDELKRAADNGVNYKMLHSRIHRYGWDKERAITTPKMTKSQRGKEYGKRWLQRNPGIAKALEHLHPEVSKDLLYARVSKGWDPMEAATTPKIPQELAYTRRKDYAEKRSN